MGSDTFDNFLCWMLLVAQKILLLWHIASMAGLGYLFMVLESVIMRYIFQYGRKVPRLDMCVTESVSAQKRRIFSFLSFTYRGQATNSPHRTIGPQALGWAHCYTRLHVYGYLRMPQVALFVPNDWESAGQTRNVLHYVQILQISFCDGCYQGGSVGLIIISAPI